MLHFLHSSDHLHVCSLEGSFLGYTDVLELRPCRLNYVYLMSSSVCVCVHTCLYVCVCMLLYTCVHLCVYVYILYALVFVDTCVYTYGYLYVYV